MILTQRFCASTFLSTLSLRRATLEILLHCLAIHNFYPRSPCGERLDYIICPYRRIVISIHALLAESDSLSVFSVRSSNNFYPRSPCGERLVLVSMICLPRDFYPRSPCGERLVRITSVSSGLNFYPRSPCGERRVTVLGIQHKVGISIHALLAESDGCYSLRHSAQGWHFYPRSPCGERQSYC